MRLELKFCSAMKKALLTSLFIAGELKWNFVLKVVRVAQEWPIKKRKNTETGMLSAKILAFIEKVLR